jgi:hypothetical protein
MTRFNARLRCGFCFSFLTVGGHGSAVAYLHMIAANPTLR